METYATLINLSVVLTVVGFALTCMLTYRKYKSNPQGIFRTTGLSALTIHTPIAIYMIGIGIVSFNFVHNYQPPSRVIMSDQEALNLVGNGLGLYIGSICAIFFGGLYLISSIATSTVCLSEKLLRKLVY